MSRLRQIDVLRAVAVFLVLGRHMKPCPAESSRLLHAITAAWTRGGWIGVDLFFVLSGFLVSGLLFREHETFGRIEVRRFLVRRGLKIYPAFWLLIGVTVAVAASSGQGGAPWLRNGLVSELLFVQNYRAGLWNHTWSLAVEEHFYLLLALLFAAVPSLRGRPLSGLFAGLFVVLAVGCLGLRVANAWHHPYAHETHVFPSHLRFDALFFGVLLASLYDRSPEHFLAFATRSRYALLVGAVALLSPPFAFEIEATPLLYTYGFTLVYLGSGLLLVAALGSRPAGRWVGPLAYAGSRSYSIYLWHMPVATWVAPAAVGLLFGDERWGATFVAYVLGSVTLGLIGAGLVEIPVLRLRDRVFPSRAARPRMAAVDQGANARPRPGSGGRVRPPGLFPPGRAAGSG